MARHAQLRGGPEDGATVWLPDGDLPARVGVHRLPDGALVPIRGRALTLELGHVAVYERATIDVLRAWTRAVGMRVAEPTGRAEAHPACVHRELVTRWTAREGM
jgi:hypothetical protein